MAIKCNNQTFEYFGETACLSTQSAVECRFPGDMATVLAVNANPSPISCRADNGEVEYRGRLLLTVVYEDGEKNVCRTERGVEFTHRAEHEACTPASKAFVNLSAAKVSVRREGSGVYVSVVVAADITLTAPKSFSYASGGEGFIFRGDEAEAVFPVYGEGEIETDDEFDTEYVGDLLLHSERINITSVSAADGTVTVSGEISFCVCALKSGGALVSYERLIPFRGEIECEGAARSDRCCAVARVKDASVNAGTDEEKGTCHIRCDLTLSLRVTVYGRKTLSFIADAFSCENKLEIGRGELTEEYLFDCVRFTERASGAAGANLNGGAALTFADSLQAVTLAEANLSCVKSDGKEFAEGALTAKVILADAENAHRSIDITLPFSLPLNIDEDGRREIEALPCGVVVRQRQEGEVEAEATLKICVKIYKTRRVNCVCSITEGEAIEDKKSAFSVYIASSGEDLWSTAKRLNKPPQEIEKYNPDLKFPLRGDERIIVYRKI